MADAATTTMHGRDDALAAALEEEAARMARADADVAEQERERIEAVRKLYRIQL